MKYYDEDEGWTLWLNNIVRLKVEENFHAVFTTRNEYWRLVITRKDLFHLCVNYITRCNKCRCAYKDIIQFLYKFIESKKRVMILLSPGPPTSDCGRRMQKSYRQEVQLTHLIAPWYPLRHIRLHHLRHLNIYLHFFNTILYPSHKWKTYVVTVFSLPRFLWFCKTKNKRKAVLVQTERLHNQLNEIKENCHFT